MASPRSPRSCAGPRGAGAAIGDSATWPAASRRRSWPTAAWRRRRGARAARADPGHRACVDPAPPAAGHGYRRLFRRGRVADQRRQARRRRCRRRVELADHGDRLVIEVRDEGPAGANTTGTGLMGLAIAWPRSTAPCRSSPAGGGTTVRASCHAGSDRRGPGAAARGLVALLREQGIDVVAQAKDGPGLLRIVSGHKPDLAIVDGACRRASPTRACAPRWRRACASRARRPRPLAVRRAGLHAELLESGEGGIGYLLKERVGDVRGFVDAVQRAARGGTALDREVVAELMRSRTGGPAMRHWRP